LLEIHWRFARAAARVGFDWDSFTNPGVRMELIGEKRIEEFAQDRHEQQRSAG